MVARAAVRRPGVAFKGGRARLGNRGPGTGRGRDRGAAACSACPAPRPLDRGWRPGRAVASRLEGGWGWGGRGGRAQVGQVTGAGDTPGPPGPLPNHSPSSASWGGRWDVGEQGLEKMGDSKGGDPKWLLSENFNLVGGKVGFTVGRRKRTEGPKLAESCI